MIEDFSRVFVVLFGFLSGACFLSGYFAERVGKIKGKMAKNDNEAIEEEGAKLKYFWVLTNIKLFSSYLFLMLVFVYSEPIFMMDTILIIFALLNLFIAVRLTRELMQDGCRSALINTIENDSSSLLVGYTCFFVFIFAIDLILRIRQLGAIN